MTRAFFFFLCFISTLTFGKQPEGPFICLSMMIEDDETVIERCLKSVEGIVDCISIINNGSTDETSDILSQFMQETGIPGKIYPCSTQHAEQKLIEDLGLSLEQTYILEIEPDQKLHIHSQFKKEDLVQDAYEVLDTSFALSCTRYVQHLFRASKSEKKFHHLEKLKTLALEGFDDRQYNIRKLQSSISRLTEQLAANPSEPRLLFNLAQSHKGLKQYNDAIFWYEKRLEQQGDQEEAWFAKCMIGECLQEKGEWDKALYWYLEAYQFNPYRADPLQKIATHYRYSGQNDLACVFAKYGVRIPEPADPTIFSLNPSHPYLFNETLSIAAYYTQFREDGFHAANNLILTKNVPWYIKDLAYCNMLFYVQELPNATYEPIQIELPLICKGSDERFYPMNPSIQKTPNGYQVICRTVNYTQKGAKEFETIDPTGVFRNRNFILHYDKKFNLISQQEIIETLSRERFPAFNLEGLEDCRLFTYNNESWFSCTTCDTNPTGQRQISLCKLAKARFTPTIHVETLIPLIGPDLHRCEKNWLPFIKDGQLHLIYSYDPFVIVKPDLETGECQTVYSYEPTHNFSTFRGSAAPIPFDEGYLMLVHEVVHHQDHTRSYLHRFLYLNKNFSINKLSKPFTFRHSGIEFCVNMTIDHTGTRLILPIGIEDHEAYLCFVDFATIRNLLEPLPAL